MKDSKLTPPLVFIIGLVTLGVANFFFVYRFSELINVDSNGKTIYPMREAMFNIMTFGLYGIYWSFKLDRILDKREGNDSISATSVLVTILSAIPLVRTVAMTLICNRMIET